MVARRVEGQARVDLGGDAAVDQAEDARAERDQHAIELRGDRLRPVRAQRVDQQRPVLRLLRRLQDQRRVRRGVARAQPFDRREIAGVGDDRRPLLESVQSGGHGSCRVARRCHDIIRKFICSQISGDAGRSSRASRCRRPVAASLREGASLAPLIVDPRPVAALVLADGTIFRGRSIGAPGRTLGEVVFNTAMTGYQEILTDPSYAGQIVTLTYPHIGNTGVNDEDVEAPRVLRRRPRDPRPAAASVELPDAARPRRPTCATKASSASPTSTPAS